MAADLQKPLTAWHAPDKWVDRQREAWADGYNRALAITAALRAEAGAVGWQIIRMPDGKFPDLFVIRSPSGDEAEVIQGDDRLLWDYFANVAAMAGGWQPIESAPKDAGILASNPEWMEAAVVRWDEHYSEWMESEMGVIPQPTHWQPLPPRPSQKD